MRKYSYYPGCSLTGTAKDYNQSVFDTARILDIELIELPDWNCCGASSAHMLNNQQAMQLSIRNLKLAGEAGHDLLVPCAACYHRLCTADFELKKNPLKWGIASYHPKISIIQLSSFLRQSSNLELISKSANRGLNNLPVACYYGCLSLRPPKITGATDYEQPNSLDQIIEALSGKPLSWSHKTECCSGSLTMAKPEITRVLVKEIINAAIIAGAGAIVTDCPMCQANLETRQLDLISSENFDPLPVFYATELITAVCSGADNRKNHYISTGILKEYQKSSAPDNLEHGHD